MAISNYGELKAELSAYLFHQRFAPTIRQLHAICSKLPPIAGCGCGRWRHRVAHHRQRRGGIAGRLSGVAHRAAEPTDRHRRPIRTGICPSGLSAADVPVNHAIRRLFTIEGNTFKVRPIDDALDAYELHYYQKIPTIAGHDANTNWLLTEYPDVYIAGVMTELFVARTQHGSGATVQGAARRAVRGDDPAVRR